MKEEIRKQILALYEDFKEAVEKDGGYIYDTDNNADRFFRWLISEEL